MQKLKKSWFFVFLVFLLMSSCISPSSVSTSESCSGDMIVEKSRYKELYGNKREHQVKGNDKAHRKARNK
jgi:hypothetical protein